MERDWTKKVNGRWRRPRWVLRKCLCASFIPPHRPQKPPPLGKPALVVATKQPPTPPPPSAHPPKLPQRPVSQPRSSTGSVASQASIPRRLQRRLPGLHTHTLRKQLLPLAHKHAAPASTTAYPTLRRYRRHPAPIPTATATALAPSLTAYFHLRPVFHPFTRHNDLPYIHILPRLPLGHNNIDANDAGSEATGVSDARAVRHALRRKRAHAPTKTPKPPPSTPTPAKHQNAGWRGLSIDIDTIVGASHASAQTEPGPEPGPDARLDGRVVRAIWLKSRLESQRLRDIWNECDLDGTGSLDRDAFARGMVQIDEELRKARLLGRASAGWNAASAARALRAVPSRPILR